MTSKELNEVIRYANSLGSTNPERKAKIEDLLRNAKQDELRDLDQNTLVWLLEGLDRAEKDGQRAPLVREHVVFRGHNYQSKVGRTELKPEVSVKTIKKSVITDPRGINAASESTGSSESDADDFPDSWISTAGEVVHTEGG